MKYFYPILCFLLFSFIACEPSASSTTSTTTSTAVPTPKAAPTGTPLPSMSQEEMMYLFNNCDYIDYVFYSTNFSISQNTQESIRSMLNMISPTTATLNPNCKAIGRVFYQVKGENYAEADLYFQEGCTYLVFLEKNKPIAGHILTDQGVAYFNNIFQRAQNMAPGAQ